MAIKITATLIVRNANATKAIISNDLDTAAYEVAKYLTNHLGTIVPTEGISITVEDVKRDGTPKTDGRRTGTYQI